LNNISKKRILLALELRELQEPFTSLEMREFLVSKYGAKNCCTTRAIGYVLKGKCRATGNTNEVTQWRYRDD
tara:strand:+ start:1294 stop:1509 length:216 start_codon:yes stop_codon:yes gene_type:complete